MPWHAILTFWDIIKNKRGSEEVQSTLYVLWKCHNETFYFVQLIYANLKTVHLSLSSSFGQGAKDICLLFLFLLAILELQDMCLQCILIRFSCSIILPYSPTPLLRTISIGFLVLFSYIYTKYLTIITLLHPLHLPSPPLNRPCFTFLFFIFKCILIVQRGFALVFHTCIYCTLLRLTPLYYLLFIRKGKDI
jgi:hypothetical protein